MKTPATAVDATAPTRPPPDDAGRLPRLTVLICTHNRADLLARALASLNTAVRPANWQVDVLVAANACSDSTHDLLENYRQEQAAAGSIPLEWFAEPTPGKSHALNSAIARLTADVVAFTDDDQRVDLNYLVNICRAVEKYPKATMFCGRLLPDWDGSEPDWVHDEGPYRIYPLPVPRYDLGPLPKHVFVDPGPLPGGGNLFMRVDTFSRVGRFSTELGPHGHDLGGGEDSAFILGALNDGEHLQYVPDILQHHYVDVERLQFSYLMRKAYQRSRAVSCIHHDGSAVPLYMWRKLTQYGLMAAIPISWPRTRFYLMRIASTLGEIRGQREASRRAQPRPATQTGLPTDTGCIWPAMGGILLLLALAALAIAVPLEILLPNLLAAGVVALALGAALAVKSLVDFSQTGPQVRGEILVHYRKYSLFALARVTAWAFVLLLAQAASGALAYGASAWLLGLSVQPWASAGCGLVAIALITGLQFCRHLLLLPASLAASSHYRMSRFYPLWHALSPRRLRILTAALGLPVVALTTLLGTALARAGESAGMLSLVAFAGTAACVYRWLQPDPWRRPVAAKRRGGPPNVLMIGCDTLRADRIGPTFTPFIDRLARNGAHFTQCYVPCSRTAPSLISLLTGTWPHTHGIRDNFVADSDTRLGVTPLPQHLREHGYLTAALSDWCGSDMSKFPFGFDYTDLPEDQWNLKFFIRQGPKDLRLFLSLFTHNAFGKRFLPEIHYLGGVPMTGELGAAGGQLLNRLAGQDKPFLLNIFFSTTHPPFGSEYPYYTCYSHPDYAGQSKFAMARLTDPWEILRRQAEPREAFDLDQIIHLYDGCVRRFDDEVARLMAHLQNCGLADDTVVVLYSDHGMEFFEHDTWGQGNSAVGDHSARIPLIVLDPRAPHGQRINDVVRSIDVAPTLLELLGLPPAAAMDGISLVPRLRDPAARLQLDAYNETGIWMADMPGMRPDHLRYPNLLEMLEVPDKATGTLAIKPEYASRIIAAKDRMLRHGRWKLVYQPLEEGELIRLYDLETDPGCRRDVAPEHPEILTDLRVRLQQIMASDPGLEACRQELPSCPCPV
jgi:arylsulfatase A-like enzyme/glycosyltransferase involved in cell wall biosynthesis